MNAERIEESPPSRLLVACYQAMPFYSASSDILNRLLLAMEVGDYHLVSQDYRKGGVLVDDVAVPYEALGVVRFDSSFYQRIRPLINLLIIPLLAVRMVISLRKHKCRKVLAVYPDFRFTMAAVLAAKFSRLPFYVWTHNSMESMQWPTLFIKVLRVESLVLKSAKCVFAMSDGMKRHYENRFPDVRVVTLPHPIAVDRELQPTELAYVDQPIRLLFSGGINAGNWDALGRLLEAFGGVHGYEIHICTRLNQAIFRSRFGEWSNVVFHGFVTSEELECLVRSSHVLLLPHGLSGPYPIVEYITMFPTKAVSYMASNRPIFAHATKNSAISVFLEARKAAVVVSNPSVEQLRVEMRALVESEAIRSSVVENAQEAIEYFNVCRVVDILKTELACS
jgi:glycosyltransferase involved in cell wall biosynthesis